MRIHHALALALLISAPARADNPALRELKIESVDYLETRFAVKPHPPTLAEGEGLTLRVKVSGMVERNGNLHCTLGLELKGEDGKSKAKSDSMSGGDFKNSLGQTTGTFFIEINNIHDEPAKYTMILTAKDHFGDRSAQWEGPLTLEKAKLGIYTTRFLLRTEKEKEKDEEEHRREIASLLFVGGQVDIAFRVLGLTAEGGRVHLAMQVEVYDARIDEKLYTTEGKELAGLELKGRSPNGEVSASHTLSLTRPGRFYVRLVVTDKLAEKTVKREVRFRVVTPDEMTKEY